MNFETQRPDDALPDSASADPHEPFVRRDWALSKAALTVSRLLGLFCALFGAVVLAGGYLAEIELLYRPIVDGPATNPLTALCVLVLGLGLGTGGSLLGGWPQRVFAAVAVLLTLSKLSDVLFGTAISPAFTPFPEMVMRDLALGKANAMGTNSTLMLGLIALAFGLGVLRRQVAAQILGFLALGIPLVSFTGYAYGFDRFYGQMSLLTATVGFLLALSTLAMTAHRGALKAVLSPYIGGRIARLQIALGLLVPFTMGYLMVEGMLRNQHFEWMGIFIIATSWFISALICVSAVIQERVDNRRRFAEQRLLFSAMNDPLTRLPNRRKFFEVGNREMDRTRRSQADLWVLMIDIDHFKRINDTAGHAMGDQVLVAVAGFLARSIRAVDMVGRLGGEEFAILLSDTTAEGVRLVAEKIRGGIESLAIDGWTDAHGPVTISIGCAPSASKAALDDVLNAADEALYEAKRGGRNRVVFEPPEPLAKVATS